MIPKEKRVRDRPELGDAARVPIELMHSVVADAQRTTNTLAIYLAVDARRMTSAAETGELRFDQGALRATFVWHNFLKRRANRNKEG